MDYSKRTVDNTLDWLLKEAKAVCLDGPKAVGKTATAKQRAQTAWYLDDPAFQELAAADFALNSLPPGSVLIDEWQRFPQIWDSVRRKVDAGVDPGRFILTGSATPVDQQGTHSGAGRIFSVRMRPMALHERPGITPTVSFEQLLAGDLSNITGKSQFQVLNYMDAITNSGFPELQDASPRYRKEFLTSYLERIIDRDLPEIGVNVRQPESLRRWLAAYAAATATTTSYSALLNATTGGDGTQPTKETTTKYRDFLRKIWIIDDVPAWLPVNNELKRLGQAPKHHLADPALAATILGLNTTRLTNETGIHMAGPLFESLVTLGVQVLAQAASARVSHLRMNGGEHEIDLIVTGLEGEILALEVKLAHSIQPADIKHLLWLREKLAPQQVTCAVITTGPFAYVRTDGIAVIPLACLGL